MTIKDREYYNYEGVDMGATFTDNLQIVWSGQLPETGSFQFVFDDEVTLQPGETLSVCARATTGTPAYVSASLNTREDQ